MAYVAMKPTKPGLEESQERLHRIRITLSSKNVKNLEKDKFCADLVRGGKDKGLTVKGPVRMSTKVSTSPPGSLPVVKEPTPGIGLNFAYTRG